MHVRMARCCFFSTFQNCLAFGGQTSHRCRSTWVSLGNLKPFFPDSGGSVTRIGAVRCGHGPCSLTGVFSIADRDQEFSLHEHRREIVVWVRDFDDRLDDGSSPNVLLLSDFGALRSHCRPRCYQCPDPLLAKETGKSSRLVQVFAAVLSNCEPDPDASDVLFTAVFSNDVSSSGCSSSC
jgi:hypothetical protein